MSDVPPNQTDNNDSSGLQGGWMVPQSPGAWREPENSPEPDGWKVPVLPPDMAEEAEETGAWHLPDPEDTTFTRDDEIEITEATRPEDQLLELAALVSDELPPAEDPEPEGPVAPEDLMYLIEHMDEEEEPENPQMSELLALASLVEEEPAADDDSSITAVVLDDDDEETDDLDEGLSAAEKLILNSRPGPDDDTGTADPANYAAQQLAQLGLSGDDNADPLGNVDISNEALTGSTSGPPATSDPANYAAQQLAQLGLDDTGATGVGMPTGPSAPVVEPEDPRQVELGRQFRQTEEQVATLRRMVQNGQLSQDDYVNQLRDLMILDDDQNWWMMGVESDQWYKSENNAWVEAQPEPLAALRRYEQQQQPGTGAAPMNTQYAVNDSLPYINDQQQVSPEERSDYGGSGGIRLDDDFMPMPDPAPVDDYDATVAGPSAYAQNLDYGAETVPGGSFYESTQQAQPLDYNPAQAADAGYGNTAAYSPDLSQAPAYDLEQEGEIYSQAVDRQQRQNNLRWTWAAVGVFFVIAVLVGGFIFAATTWYGNRVSEFEPSIAALFNVQQASQLTVTILDRNGVEIASIEPEGENRRPLDSLNQISNEALHAFLTLEDPNYYDSIGWNLTTRVNALFQDLTGGTIDPLTSPIIQRLVQERVFTGIDGAGQTRTDELIIAAELVDRYSEDELLLLYLNEVLFFGNQIYGIEAAAQTYFDKPASELNIAEAAFLAAIPQNPVENEPANNKETTIALMLIVLERMGETGCVQISESGEEFCVTPAMVSVDIEGDGQAAIPVAQVRVRDYSQEEEGIGEYPHFTLLVRDILQSVYGNDIYAGGYTVRTTLDSEVQEMVQQAVMDQVSGLNGVNSGSALVTDPRTGEILALVGSPNFEDEDINGQNDYTRAFLRSGDIIKPIIYAAALQGVDRNGSGTSTDFGEYYTPATVLWDVPIAYDENGQTYQPTNRDGSFRGDIPVRDALQLSLNVPAVEAFRFLGTAAFQQVAEGMGLRFVENEEGVLNLGLRTALGETRVRLLDVVEAYGTIANDGQFVGLTAILEITDTNGVNIPLPPPPTTQQVLSPAAAFLMQDILSDNTTRTQPGSPFVGNNLLVLNNQPTTVAAKSGTTFGNNAVQNLWSVGFTNNYVVGVWLGTFDESLIRENYQGSVHAASLWNEILRFVVERDGSLTQFQPPDNGTVFTTPVCPLTGGVNGPCGQSQSNERFAQGRNPPDATIIGQGIVTQATIDSWTGLLANENCPQNQIIRTFVNIDNSAAVEWINGTAPGQQYARAVELTTPVQQVPTAACTLNTTIPTVNMTRPVPNEQVQGNAYAIVGQVAAEAFARYEFQYAPVNTDSFVAVPGITAVTQQQTTPGSTLATWDTTQIPNGQYTLRLAVFSQNNGFLYRDVPIQVNNPLPTPTPIPTQAPTLVPTVAAPVDPIPFDPVPGVNDPVVPPVEGATEINVDARPAPTVTEGTPQNPLGP